MWSGFVLGIAAAGCGDEVVCPRGTTGSPCRYTLGVGDAPILLPVPDVHMGDAGDGSDANGSEIQDVVDVPDNDGNGDITDDAAELNDGPDTTDDADTDRDPRDSEPDVGSAGADGLGAMTETPDASSPRQRACQRALPGPCERAPPPSACRTA